MEDAKIPAGVIGLGLMGTSISAALVAAGHRVTAVTNNPEHLRSGYVAVREHLDELRKFGRIQEEPSVMMEQFRTTEDYSDLAECQVVVESIVEDLTSKRAVIQATERVVSPEAIIGSNTSAIPVTLLQQGAANPERILGIHWAEPAHTTRFMEIICGDGTSAEIAERTVRLARTWGKEPTLVRRDIRGFIANRLMYAMFREAFYLVENGYATVEDIDSAARGDMGCWITLAGPFRFMDLTGISAYRAVIRDLFPELSSSTTVPTLMDRVVDAGGLGIANGKGFYEYTPEQARHWDEKFKQFSHDIDVLSRKYSEDD